MLELNPDAFNDFLYGIGQDCTWAPSYVCPCMTSTSGSANPGCPRCHGRGRIWDAAQPTTVGFASQKSQLEWAKLGLWISGDAVVVIPEDSAMYDMSQYDHVVMLNSTDNFSKVLTHGAVTERLLVTVKAFTRVFWLDGSSNIVEGGLPVVATDGSLSWPNGGEPPANTQYSLNGSRYSEYYCLGPFASDRNEHRGARLPKRVVLRQWDLFGRTVNQPFNQSTF